jgi:hypothetical protein
MYLDVSFYLYEITVLSINGLSIIMAAKKLGFVSDFRDTTRIPKHGQRPPGLVV